MRLVADVVKPSRKLRYFFCCTICKNMWEEDIDNNDESYAMAADRLGFLFMWGGSYLICPSCTEEIKKRIEELEADGEHWEE